MGSENAGLRRANLFRHAVTRQSERKGAVVDIPEPVHLHRGRRVRGDDAMVISCALYRAGQRVESVADFQAGVEAARESEDPSDFVWLGVVNPSEAEFYDLGEQFGIPTGAIEDALTQHERAKMEQFDDIRMAILKPVTYVEATEDIEVSDLAVFTGPGFALTVRRGASEIPAHVRADLEKRPTLLARGPEAVMYRILDTVVDDYMDVISAIALDIEDIEVKVFSGTGELHTERVYLLKREVLEFRRAEYPLIRPLEEMLEEVRDDADDDPDGAGDEYADRIRDVYDHILRVNDELESFSTQLTDILQAELAQVSVTQNEVAMQQNEDARKISAWAAIGLIPTIAGSNYGMNFEHMPELAMRWGYPTLLGAELVIVIGLNTFFKRNKWL